ncbi:MULTISPECIES: TOMM precursor leader peptide-binding protein [unclassified Streptomyces]|uniref:TOMM precursor leader peptide-binding protein n=1 Tax=unclassified Streptomyces TaxID=2593676 RepID=UPI001BEC5BB8|nr:MULTISPECIES: TOMM precursor leader peptide-binding protein [unclassified Streptomyces]MBT2405456.1 TOMM precursor leader peptide-binding protein [Streptomyces sp. ISL-21]MBT2608057.1 TOMM precursor leader peptide-binding protein [Streptomyces sp. ISL-87]
MTSTTTRFKRYVRSTTVAGDGVYLTTERSGQLRLEGRMIELMAPLLQGGHTREEIADRLSDEFAPARVGRALDKLIAAGHVVETDASVDPRAGGYWELLGVDGDEAVRAVRNAGVDLVALGDVRAEWFTDAAEAFGIRLTDAPDSALTVVLTDDYLRPELDDINRRALAGGKPWLLVKPVGATVWLGPVFQPGVSACYECLRIRLANKHMLTSYLRQRGVLTDVLVNSVTDVPATVGVAAQLAALETAKWLAGAVGGALPGTDVPRDQVTSLDTLTLRTEQHPVTRRPQCPACGDPDLQAKRQRGPVELSSQVKAVASDGGHRAKDPQEFLDTFQHLVSPISGPVSSLVKVPLDVEGLHTYTAGQNFAVPMANAADLRAGLRSASSGKGISDVQARASALGEAIERYSGVFHGDEARITSSYEALGADRAIEPNALHQYSDRQFADRLEWNARPSHFHWVSPRMNPAEPVDWSPVWSLTEQRHKYLPTSALYFSYSSSSEAVRFNGGANSNGCAAGTTLEDAILQGFFELVERDSVAMWWYHRLRMPRIDLDSFDDPYFRKWQDRYRSLGRETWVLDVTNDLGIPSVVAVSYRTDKPVQDVLFALGSHFDVKIAIGRALSEMNQFLPAVIGMRADGSGTYAYNDPDQLKWWQTATVQNQPYMRPADGVVRTAADYAEHHVADLREDVLRAQRAVEDKGMEMLVLDQTRVDIGLPVARVIVPGMRHFWPRYAPGRLYDVPVELGWLDRKPSEDDLNPIAMFL